MTKVRDFIVPIDEVKKEPKFEVGDHVFSHHFGKGVVAHISDPTKSNYPVAVSWIGKDRSFIYANKYYTIDGQFHDQYPDPEYDIIKEEENWEEDTKMGQIASVINNNIAKKMNADEEKMSVDDRKFKVGERVWSPYFGGGTVTSTEVEAGDVFPIEVHWNDGHPFGDYDFFTEDGKYTVEGEKPEMGIYHIDPKDAEKVLPNILHELGEDEDEGNKKVEDAINPSHYKVEGLPEAIDIMNHLMTPEQFEGFLWGNIMKYAYRFGRKGDKAETAGKIAWYANQLKAVEEWGKEHNET